MHRSRRLTLLCTAAVLVLLCTAPAASAQQEQQPSTATPTTSDAVTPDGTSNTTLTLSRVDQTVPAFSGVRSCLPFNILLAAAAEKVQGTEPSDSSSALGQGRIIIEADYNVINSTVATVEDGILTLSLAGGFESQQAINFTVVMPATTQLRYVANYGSGLLVLGPGHNTSYVRLVAPTVGQIQALNLTADTLAFSANGVLGSSISGAFTRAEISTSVATGSVAFSSVTPVAVTVDLSGITTLVADVPQGSSITGTAGGLSKVQYTGGTCSVTSQTPLLFPAPSIFGRGGFGFGFGNDLFASSKCQQVALQALQPVVAVAENPQWTCGVIVDGQLSCQGGNATEPALVWNISNVTSYEPTPSPVDAVTNTSDAASGSAAGGANTADGTATAAVMPSDDTASTAGGAGTTDNVASIAVEPSPDDTTGTTAGTTGTTAGTTGTTADTTAGGTGARKLLQDTASPPPFGGFAGLTPITTTFPAGNVTTGSFTSGPGSFASGTGAVPGGGQTTTSQGGSTPQTTQFTGGIGSSIFNPVFVPSTPAQTFATDATSPAPASPSPSPSPLPTTVSPSPAPASPTATVRITTTGPGGAAGVAVANTVCSSQVRSLSMLALPGSNSTGVTNTTTGTGTP